MKKINLILAALAAVLAISCNKEITNVQTPDDSVPAGMKMVTLTAGIDAAETKTTYDADGKFSWTKGDQISVMGTDYKFYTLTAEQTGASSSFSGLVPEDVKLRQEAFYPADPGIKREGSDYFYSIPEYKDLSSSFSADLPMGAYSGTDVYQFKHITGAALLTFTNIPDEVVSAEISIVNSSLKLSGVFGTWTNDGMWTYGVAAASTESEGRFVRKVPVINNTARIYLPYASDGNLWADCTIDIIGYDSAQNEMNLLQGKKMKGNGSSFPRGTVVPYAALDLPDYFPPVNLASIDWTKATVVSETGSLTSLEYFADSYYVYARLKGSATALETASTTAADRLTIFLYDALEGTGDGFWGNYAGSKGNTEHEVATLFSEGYELNISIAGTTITSDVVVSGDIITWRFAFPRSIDVLNNSGKAYIGFMPQDANGNARGSIPSTSKPLLEVTLP